MMKWHSRALIALVTVFAVVLSSCDPIISVDLDFGPGDEATDENTGDGTGDGTDDGSGDGTDDGSGDTPSDPGDGGDTTDPNTYSVIRVSDPSFTLAWDASVDPVSSYTVHYRTHGEADWNLLGETGSGDILEFTVDETLLAYGEYDFAVQAVYSDGQASTYHTSLDGDAEPTSGWYLDWGP